MFIANDKLCFETFVLFSMKTKLRRYFVKKQNLFPLFRYLALNGNWSFVVPVYPTNLFVVAFPQINKLQFFISNRQNKDQWFWKTGRFKAYWESKLDFISVKIPVKKCIGAYILFKISCLSRQVSTHSCW